MISLRKTIIIMITRIINIYKNSPNIFLFIIHNLLTFFLFIYCSKFYLYFSLCFAFRSHFYCFNWEKHSKYQSHRIGYCLCSSCGCCGSNYYSSESYEMGSTCTCISLVHFSSISSDFLIQISINHATLVETVQLMVWREQSKWPYTILLWAMVK
jgi:hypothetical protein